MNQLVRQKAIIKTCLISILTNITFASFKAFAGILSGSITITLDAINNLTDAFGSIITIIGIKVSQRSPDKKHPFGYGRIEYFGTIIISIMILLAGITSFKESVLRIMSQELAHYTLIPIIIILVSVCVKLFLGRYVIAQGRKYNSQSLIASGKEARFDALVSLFTLIGALIIYLFSYSIDGYIGATIALLIIKTGSELLLGSLSDIMGNRADSEITKNIKEAVNSFEHVLGAYDLIIHNYGPNKAIGSIHVEVPSNLSADEIHVLSNKIQRFIIKEYHVYLTVGIYSVDVSNQEKIEIRNQIINICNSHVGVLNTHGIYIDNQELFISFDMIIDFSIKDKEAFKKHIINHIHSFYPQYRIYIKFDLNYSD